MRKSHTFKLLCYYARNYDPDINFSRSLTIPTIQQLRFLWRKFRAEEKWLIFSYLKSSYESLQYREDGIWLSQLGIFPKILHNFAKRLLGCSQISLQLRGQRLSLKAELFQRFVGLILKEFCQSLLHALANLPCISC